MSDRNIHKVESQKNPDGVLHDLNDYLHHRKVAPAKIQEQTGINYEPGSTHPDKEELKREGAVPNEERINAADPHQKQNRTFQNRAEWEEAVRHGYGKGAYDPADRLFFDNPYSERKENSPILNRAQEHMQGASDLSKKTPDEHNIPDKFDLNTLGWIADKYWNAVIDASPIGILTGRAFDFSEESKIAQEIWNRKDE